MGKFWSALYVFIYMIALELVGYFACHQNWLAIIMGTIGVLMSFRILEALEGHKY